MNMYKILYLSINCRIPTSVFQLIIGSHVLTSQTFSQRNVAANLQRMHRQMLKNIICPPPYSSHPCCIIFFLIQLQLFQTVLMWIRIRSLLLCSLSFKKINPFFSTRRVVRARGFLMNGPYKLLLSVHQCWIIASTLWSPHFPRFQEKERTCTSRSVSRIVFACFGCFLSCFFVLCVCVFRGRGGRHTHIQISHNVNAAIVLTV